MPQLLSISCPIESIAIVKTVTFARNLFLFWHVFFCFFFSLVRFKTRIKVARGHSVLFQWHGYILRHKTHRKTYWQTDTKQDCQVECVHHSTATHCHQEKHTQPSFYTLSCRIPFNFSPPPPNTCAELTIPTLHEGHKGLVVGQGWRSLSCL